MKFILFSILVISGFMVMGTDPYVIQETFKNVLFFCASVLVGIFGLKMFIEAIKN